MSPANAGLFDGYVTLVAPVAVHTLPPRLSRDWGRTDGHRHRIVSSASSLQIAFGEKLSLCSNIISVTWFHTAGKFSSILDKSHFSRIHFGKGFNFTVGGCDSHPPALLPP